MKQNPRSAFTVPSFKLLAALAVLAVPHLGFAQNAPVLELSKGDVTLVKIELEPNDTPKLLIYFSKAKAFEAQTLIEANYDKRIKIVSNGKLVVEPRIQTSQLAKKKLLTLEFPTADDALDVAKLLVPNY